MALEELADFANYVRYMFVKYYILLASMDQPGQTDAPFKPGPLSFTPTGSTEE